MQKPLEKPSKRGMSVLPLFKSVFVMFHLLNARAAMVSEIYKTTFGSAVFVLEVSPADKTVLMFPTLLQVAVICGSK